MFEAISRCIEGCSATWLDNRISIEQARKELEIARELYAAAKQDFDMLVNQVGPELVIISEIEGSSERLGRALAAIEKGSGQ